MFEQPLNENQPTAQERSEQDININADINDTLIMMENISSNPDIAAILTEHGYGEERLSEGVALCETCREAFHARGAAITAQKNATAVLNGREQTARQMYSDFRLTAHGLFPNERARSELALTGEVPDDRGRFLGIANMSVKAARKEPYAARFAEFGLDPAALDNLESAFLDVAKADGVQNTAIIDAIEATKIRDKAYAELTDWLQQFRKVATAALHRDPEKLKVLEV